MRDVGPELVIDAPPANVDIGELSLAVHVDAAEKATKDLERLANALAAVNDELEKMDAKNGPVHIVYESVGEITKIDVTTLDSVPETEL